MSSAIEEVATYLAFYHKHHGKECLQYILNGLRELKQDVPYYEMIADVIDDLRATGLLDCANDLETLQQDLPHEWDLECPEQPPHDKPWHERMKKKKAEWEIKNSRKG